MKKISIIILICFIFLPSIAKAFNKDSLIKIYASDKFSKGEFYKLTYC
jgi:hypothetical protein